MSLKVLFRASHLHFKADLVKAYFGSESHVLIAFDAKQKIVMVSRATSTWFSKLHKDVSQLILKNRNLQGDKTLDIRAFCIDYDLDTSDRQLEIKWIQKTKILKILI